MTTTTTLTKMLYIGALYFFMPFYLYAATDTADARWVVAQNSGVFKATLQLRSHTDFKAGSASLIFEFNENGLEYDGYSPTSFKTGDYRHNLYPGSAGGAIVITYKGITTNGSILSTVWTDIGEISFNIIDSTKTSDLKIILSNTVVRKSDNTTCISLVTTDNNTPLPVKLLGLWGHNEKSNNILKWITEAEINNDHFKIERSSDGLFFTTIGEVQGNGNSQTMLQYQFTDLIPRELDNITTFYYRLKQVDYNGESAYSNTIKVVRIDKLPKVVTTTQSTVIISLAELGYNPIKATISDIYGKELYNATIVDLKTIINIENYPSGTYLCTLKQGSTTTVEKIIK